MTVHDDDERDRLVTKDRDRKRAERDNIERRDYWDKDYPDPTGTVRGISPKVDPIRTWG